MDDEPDTTAAAEPPRLAPLTIQSADDTILARQAALWDEACDRYFQMLDTLKGAMPAGLRCRVDNYYLQDAVIRGMGQRGRSFLLIFQLDTPPVFRRDSSTASRVDLPDFHRLVNKVTAPGRR